MALLLVACRTATAPLPDGAPWRGTPLSRADVPPVYITEWEKAENRDGCALIAPRSLGAGSGATPRSARFSGGWAVAYDLPARRSAFGIAGAGVKPTDESYAKWPYVQIWDDGSKAEYGPEGGSGPNQLAYLRIQGQDCLYNVWSHLGREHLEHLLRELRFVR
ncbi:MAG TPA: hypothetical protein VNA69_14235 [Thermoanaerobaculia bacterium]|nr:hypothetical protein [Thermoanaerobaculia bacterium]